MHGNIFHASDPAIRPYITKNKVFVNLGGLGGGCIYIYIYIHIIESRPPEGRPEDSSIYIYIYKFYPPSQNRPTPLFLVIYGHMAGSDAWKMFLCIFRTSCICLEKLLFVWEMMIFERILQGVYKWSDFVADCPLANPIRNGTKSIISLAKI